MTVNVDIHDWPVAVKLKLVELRLAVTVAFVDVAVNWAFPLKDVLPLLPLRTVTVAVLVVATPNVACPEFGEAAMGGEPLNVFNANAVWQVASRTLTAAIILRICLEEVFILWK
jgi:hypothetical protein